MPGASASTSWRTMHSSPRRPRRAIVTPAKSSSTRSIRMEPGLALLATAARAFCSVCGRRPRVAASVCSPPILSSAPARNFFSRSIFVFWSRSSRPASSSRPAPTFGSAFIAYRRTFSAGSSSKFLSQPRTSFANSPGPDSEKTTPTARTTATRSARSAWVARSNPGTSSAQSFSHGSPRNRR